MIFPFIILIFHLSFEKEELKCPTYKETTLEPKECLYKQSPLSILLHKCNKNSKCIIDKEIKEGICNKNEKEYDKLSYPGGKCEKDSDCLSDICTNNICEGKKSGEDCIDNSECYFKQKCLLLMKRKSIYNNSKSEQINSQSTKYGDYFDIKFFLSFIKLLDTFVLINNALF